MCEYEAQECSATNPKGALFKIKVHVIPTNLSEHFFQICYMLDHM